MERIEKRDQFLSEYDAGSYVARLMNVSRYMIEKYAEKQLADSRGFRSERSIELGIDHGIRAGTLPNVAERGIIAPGLPRAIFLLDQLPSLLRRQVTIVHAPSDDPNKRIPRVLMPHLDPGIVKRLRDKGQVILLEHPMPRLLDTNVPFSQIGRDIHNSVYNPIITDLDIRPHLPTPPPSPSDAS